MGIPSVKIVYSLRFHFCDRCGLTNHAQSIALKLLQWQERRMVYRRAVAGRRWRRSGRKINLMILYSPPPAPAKRRTLRKVVQGDAGGQLIAKDSDDKYYLVGILADLFHLNPSVADMSIFEFSSVRNFGDDMWIVLEHPLPDSFFPIILFLFFFLFYVMFFYSRIFCALPVRIHVLVVPMSTGILSNSLLVIEFY